MTLDDARGPSTSRSKDINYIVKPCSRLIGHTANIRAVSFNTEVRQILITAGWDATIRVWDTTTGICVYVCSEHNADVYSMCAHPDRPFTYISCSRDTTVRVWELRDVCSLIKLTSVWDGDLNRFVNADHNQESILNVLGYGRTLEDAHPTDFEGRGQQL